MRYESKDKKPYRQPGTVKNWIYRRGDIYLANLNQPTHVLLENVRGLNSESMVCLEQIHAIDKLRILKYLGKISKEQMSAVEDAAMESLGMPIPECVEAP